MRKVFAAVIFTLLFHALSVKVEKRILSQIISQELSITDSDTLNSRSKDTIHKNYVI